MFMNPSLVFDIICTVFWLVMALRYARKGMLSSLVQIGGSLVGLIGAWRFAVWGSAAVFNRFFAGGFRTAIAESIAAGGGVDLGQIAAEYAGFLPEGFRQSIVETCERSLSAALTDNALVLADAIVQNVLMPLLTPVISIVLFFVAYALIRMLVSLLVTVLGLVNHLPVLGAVNRGLGFAVGGFASLVDVFLLLCVIWALIVITGGGLPLLNEGTLSGSFYYKAFSLANPFLH